MRHKLIVICPLFAGTLFLLLKETRDEGTAAAAFLPTRSLYAVGCAPGDEGIYTDAGGKYIRVMPGWGNHAYAITTTSDSAQLYFNQGLTMYYSYHSREALASFREAARFDSTHPMVYWGQALALGPSYNFGYAYKMNPAVPAVLDKMNRFAEKASAREKDLIRAMNQRYDANDGADQQRQVLNQAYAAAMKPLVHNYPADLDIKALYTDAVMLLHAWDFWYNNGRPKPWTPELVQYCEDILAKNPQHPGALHYYIHVTEASRKPEVALPSANSLIRLFPGVAHMVHMSSHEYERIGYYAQGVVANEKADRSLVVYDSLAKGLFPQVHVPHYYAVDAYCALSGAMYKKALRKAMILRNSVDPTRDNHYQQYQYMYPQLAMVRMGKWQDLLQDTTVIPPDWTFAGLLHHFVQGMAAAKTGHLPAAEKHLEALQEKQGDNSLRQKFIPHTSSPYEVSKVAEHILEATIAHRQNNTVGAMKAIRQAISAEDSLIYSEPKIWLLPARQYLGAYLLQQARPAEAEKVYREDLVWNPGNGWSLLGLHQSLNAQGKTKELARIRKQYLYSFSGAETVPQTSAY